MRRTPAPKSELPEVPVVDEAVFDEDELKSLAQECAELMLSPQWTAFEKRLSARRASIFWELENTHVDLGAMKFALGKAKMLSIILRMRRDVLKELETKRRHEQERDLKAEREAMEAQRREAYINELAPVPPEPDAS